MSFERAYAMAVMLSLVLGEAIRLRRLRHAADDVVGRAIDGSRWALRLALAGAWAFGAIVLVPYLFGFEWDFPGYFVGMAIYLVWAVAVARPEWAALRGRIAAVRAAAAGTPGQRVAELRTRRLTDFVPAWALALPYLVLAAAFAYLATTGAWRSPRPTHLLVVASGILVTGVLTGRMVRFVAGPFDLRSQSPDEFAARHRTFVRGRLRLLLVFQTTYALALSASAIEMSKRSPHDAWRVDWLILGHVPFFLCAVWLLVAQARAAAQLEAERWR